MMKRAVFAVLAILSLVSGAFAQTGTVTPTPYQTVLDTSGNPISGAKVCTYLAGTTTPTTTFTDSTLGSANLNPIVTDSAGRFVAFLAPGAAYKFVYQDATGTAHTCDGAVIKSVDNISAVPASAANLDITGTAGEALTAAQWVYESDGSGGKTAGSWYKTDATNTYSSTTPVVGVVPASIASGAAGTVRIAGQQTGLTSLVAGTDYFLSAAIAGAITATAPANRRLVGRADTTSSIVLVPNPSLSTSVGTQTANTVFAGPTTGSADYPTFRALTGADLTAPHAVRVLDRKVTSTDVVSSTTETVVYTFSVPANTLGTTKALRCTLIGDYKNNSGGTATLTIKAKYGSTTIAQTATAGGADGAPRAGVYLEFGLRAANATNAQVAYGHVVNGNRTSATNAGQLLAAAIDQWGTHTAVAEDSTGALTFQITVQHDTNNALTSFREYEVLLELID